MSITLTNQITETDLQGNDTVVTQVYVKEIRIQKDGTVIATMADVTTDIEVEVINFTAAAAADNVRAQVETYAITNSLIDGTQD